MLLFLANLSGAGWQGNTFLHVLVGVHRGVRQKPRVPWVSPGRLFTQTPRRVGLSASPLWEESPGIHGRNMQEIRRFLLWTVLAPGPRMTCQSGRRGRVSRAGAATRETDKTPSFGASVIRLISGFSVIEWADFSPRFARPPPATCWQEAFFYVRAGLSAKWPCTRAHATPSLVECAKTCQPR